MAAGKAKDGTTVDSRWAGGRLVAQRGLFRGPDPVCPTDLYAAVLQGEALRDRHRLTVRPFSVVSLDTYFGRFPASYWQRWTTAAEVRVELRVTGSGELAVVASDPAGATRRVVARSVDGADGTAVSFTVALDRFLDGGFLWLDVHTGADQLVVDQLRWTVASPLPPRQCAVVICTFNRADDCVTTLEALSGDQFALGVLDAVYVVDQGTDTVQSRDSFPDVEKALEGRLRYLRQANLGGAGGFGRGMYEVTHNSDADVLLMDDDVLCEPEIVVRLSAFASSTVRPTIVGGQMLRLLHPTRLVAGAEYADFGNLMPGRIVVGALDDVDLLAKPVRPAADDGGTDDDAESLPQWYRGDRRVDADYNAWWACLIPGAMARELGLPLPLFFQWDDVEYGYRARAHGYSTVTLPGAAVWHADFDWKDADKWNEYFAIRNAMIVSALHSEFDTTRIARALSSRILRNLLAMQYGLTATIIKAVEDFLKGPSVLADGGVGAVGEVHRLRAGYPETRLHSPSEVPDVPSEKVHLVGAGAAPTYNRLALLVRLLNVALGRTSRRIGAVSHADAYWWHLAQFESVVVTDASQEGVRLRTRDRAATVVLLRRAVAAVRRVVTDGHRVAAEYRAASPELTSVDNWRRLYGQSGSST